VDHEIVVRGEGEVRAMPDLAVLRVSVDGEGRTHQEAYGAAALIAEAVDAVLAAQSAAMGRITTAALVVQPRTRWHKGEDVRTGWHARRTSLVEVAALDRVGDIAAMLAAAGASLAGPSWELDPSNDAYRQARAGAGEDARKRAAAYASALGVGVGPVAWVSEPGLRLAGSGGLGTARVASASLLSQGGTEGQIEVAPEEITVHAVVEVGFRIADPI
jgi:uncharacterized protein YggE